MRRTAVLVAVGLGLALAGCDYTDADFTQRCGGQVAFRAITADGTKEVVVSGPSTWLDEAVGAPGDVVKTFDLPDDGADVVFNVGRDLDEIDMHYCADFGEPPSPVVDETLTATGGQAEIVLHPAGYWRDVAADLVLEDVTFSDGETTVSGLEMLDAPIGRHA
jgi:hypothetical protein